MKMILYASGHHGGMEPLNKLIKTKVPDVHVESITSKQHLFERLSRPLNNISVLVSLASNTREINHLLSLNPLFDNTKLILILADRSRKMVNLGLQLSPSFISYSDSDYTDVLSVLKTIQKKQNHDFYLAQQQPI